MARAPGMLQCGTANLTLEVRAFSIGTVQSKVEPTHLPCDLTCSLEETIAAKLCK